LFCGRLLRWRLISGRLFGWGVLGRKSTRDGAEQHNDAEDP
jgi:hypothetical protein